MLLFTAFLISLKCHVTLSDFATVVDSVKNDEPLILTPLINAGKIKEAQDASEVKFNGFKNVVSYSGYFTVNEEYNSNLFFWFFPSRTSYANDPVLLWLQGGPGSSSLMGLFLENGPFTVKSKRGLKFRSETWIQTHSVIYIDNPVGTGFSFTNDGGYLENEVDIGKQLYEALLQFFKLFPNLQKNEFYISGESYAGKYVPAISHTIMKQNPGAKLKINLQGLAIGNGLCDPENQLVYGDYMYQIGLIDINGKATIDKMTQDAVDLIRKRQWTQALDIFNKLFFEKPQSVFSNMTGFHNFYNYLQVDKINHDYIEKYLHRHDVRDAIHVGNRTMNYNPVVRHHLLADFLQSIAPLLTELLDNYRVLIYSGQLDVIIPYPSTVSFLRKLTFREAMMYQTAPRYQWRVDNELAGYVKQAGKLTEVLVRDAGHLVPADKPKIALDMITRFTRNKPFHSTINN
ncbi:venom serine carboxypeptidase-like [Photinus pyralis]|nr:venom serine carboxypeptidase-like [Photinus pyralis]